MRIGGPCGCGCGGVVGGCRASCEEKEERAKKIAKEQYKYGSPSNERFDRTVDELWRAINAIQEKINGI